MLQTLFIVAVNLPMPPKSPLCLKNHHLSCTNQEMFFTTL